MSKGPFVHLSTMVGAYLSKLCMFIQTNDKVKPQCLPTSPILLVVHLYKSKLYSCNKSILLTSSEDYH